MFTKVMKAIKVIAMPLLFIVAIIACEGDIEDVGVGIVDRGLFDINEQNFDIISYSQNDLEVKANSLGQYLLGVYKNDDFGQINAGLAGQLTFFSSLDFGIDPAIDSVILNIPYQATRSEVDNSDGSPNWELDSIYGNQDVEYTLSVHELETFLNTLDPSSPQINLDYYSDETYLFNEIPLFEGSFKPNKNDTVLYIHRKEIILDEETNTYQIDTIKSSISSPSIKLPLDKVYFTDNFFTHPEAFTSSAAFVTFFNGLYLEASKISAADEPSIMSLAMSNASMNLYYTNSVSDVRTTQTATFAFGGVISNTYLREYEGSRAQTAIDNPDVINGDERLFLNGAAGSIALIDLFVDEDLEELRANNWLINEANLIFYIDDTADLEVIPERLYLYNYENETHIGDVLMEGLDVFGGDLERDDAGIPIRYKFKITNYIADILDDIDPIELTQLALKVFNISDIPTQLLDIKVKDYSWTPKGIIVHGSNSEVIDKRVKLEVIYSEKD